MNKQNLLMGTSMALLSAGGAMAADLPNYKGPAAAPVFTTFSWAGGYVGALAGFSFGDSKFESARNNGNPWCSNASVCSSGSTTGGVFGLTAGYNWQSGSFVYGLEGDISLATGNRRTASISNGLVLPGGLGQASINSIGTIRARAGWAFGDTLLFLTAGYAGLNQKLAFAGSYATGGSNTKWISAFAVGGGIEHAITRNWTVKLEGLYLAAGSKGRTITSNPAAAPPFGGKRFRASASTTLVRAGLNYKF